MSRHRLYVVVSAVTLLFGSSAGTEEQQSDVLAELMGQGQESTTLDRSVLSRITQADQSAIVQWLESPDLTISEKRPLVWGAAFAPGVESTLAIINLIDDVGAQEISQAQDLTAVTDALLVLGLSAQTEQQAFDYLVLHSRPEAWFDQIGEEACSDNEIESLASFSIHGIGAANHPESASVLDDLRKRSPAYAHRYAGDIVQAYFYLYLRESYPQENLLDYLIGEEEEYELFLHWSENEGAELVKWANESMRGPRPDPCPKYAN